MSGRHSKYTRTAAEVAAVLLSLRSFRHITIWQIRDMLWNAGRLYARAWWARSYVCFQDSHGYEHHLPSNAVPRFFYGLDETMSIAVDELGLSCSVCGTRSPRLSRTSRFFTFVTDDEAHWTSLSGDIARHIGCASPYAADYEIECQDCTKAWNRIAGAAANRGAPKQLLVNMWLGTRLAQVAKQLARYAK